MTKRAPRGSAKKPVAIIYRLSESPVAPYVLQLVPVLPNLRDACAYVCDELPGVENTLFDRVPEAEIPEREAAAVNAAESAIFASYKPIIQGLLRDSPGDTYSRGTHFSASLAELTASFEADGFRVVRLSAELAKESLSVDAGSEQASLARFDEVLPLDDEPRRQAVRDYLARGGELPGADVMRAAVSRRELARAMDPHVERWNPVDERIMDVYCALDDPGNPAELELPQPTLGDAGRDRHARLREKLMARGIPEAAIREGVLAHFSSVETAQSGASAIRSSMLTVDACWPSAIYWLATSIDELDAMQASVATAAPEPSRGGWLLASLVELVDVPRVLEAVTALIRAGKHRRTIGSRVLLALLENDAEAHESLVAAQLPHLARLSDPSQRYAVASKLVELDGRKYSSVMKAATRDCLLERRGAIGAGGLSLQKVFAEACVRERDTAAEFLTHWIASPERVDVHEFLEIASETFSKRAPLPAKHRDRLAELAKTEAEAPVQHALVKFLAQQGVTLEILEVTDVLALDHTFAVDTDAALIALYDPKLGAVDDFAWEDDHAQLAFVNGSRALMIGTGGDGTYTIRVTGGELSATETKFARGDPEVFPLRIKSGRLLLTGLTSEAREFRCPRGSYLARVTRVVAPAAKRLPDFVVQLAEGRAPVRRSIPTMAS